MGKSQFKDFIPSFGSKNKYMYFWSLNEFVKNKTEREQTKLSEVKNSMDKFINNSMRQSLITEGIRQNKVKETIKNYYSSVIAQLHSNEVYAIDAFVKKIDERLKQIEKIQQQDKLSENLQSDLIKLKDKLEVLKSCLSNGTVDYNTFNDNLQQIFYEEKQINKILAAKKPKPTTGKSSNSKDDPVLFSQQEINNINVLISNAAESVISQENASNIIEIVLNHMEDDVEKIKRENKEAFAHVVKNVLLTLNNIFGRRIAQEINNDKTIKQQEKDIITTWLTAYPTVEKDKMFTSSYLFNRLVPGKIHGEAVKGPNDELFRIKIRHHNTGVSTGMSSEYYQTYGETKMIELLQRHFGIQHQGQVQKKTDVLATFVIDINKTTIKKLTSTIKALYNNSSSKNYSIINNTQTLKKIFNNKNPIKNPFVIFERSDKESVNPNKYHRTGSTGGSLTNTIQNVLATQLYKDDIGGTHSSLAKIFDQGENYKVDKTLLNNIIYSLILASPVGLGKEQLNLIKSYLEIPLFLTTQDYGYIISILQVEGKISKTKAQIIPLFKLNDEFKLASQYLQDIINNFGKNEKPTTYTVDIEYNKESIYNQRPTEEHYNWEQTRDLYRSASNYEHNIKIYFSIK